MQFLRRRQDDDAEEAVRKRRAGGKLVQPLPALPARKVNRSKA